MLKKIRIKNFKCYGPHGADFNLSKINVIFGDNSAGKSTFLQFLDKIYNVCNLEGKCDSDTIDKYRYRHQRGADGVVSAKLRVRVDGADRSAEAIWDFKKSKDTYYELLDSTNGGFVGLDKLRAVFPVKGRKIFEHVAANRKTVVTSVTDEKTSLEKSLEKVMDDLSLALEQDRVNDILKRLGIPYSCVMEDNGESVSRVMIHDNDFNIDLPRSEVGTGVDGLVDLAMTLTAWDGGILALEEPETNVNEGQMAALAKVLSEEALKRENGQLFVECHSKIMARQWIEMVRNGALMYGTGTNSGLNILVARKTAEGTVIEDVKIDENGDVSWPMGFFPAEGELLRASYGVY